MAQQHHVLPWTTKPSQTTLYNTQTQIGQGLQAEALRVTRSDAPPESASSHKESQLRSLPRELIVRAPISPKSTTIQEESQKVLLRGLQLMLRVGANPLVLCPPSGLSMPQGDLVFLEMEPVYDAQIIQQLRTLPPSIKSELFRRDFLYSVSLVRTLSSSIPLALPLEIVFQDFKASDRYMDKTHRRVSQVDIGGITFCPRPNLPICSESTLRPILCNSGVTCELAAPEVLVNFAAPSSAIYTILMMLFDLFCAPASILRECLSSNPSQSLPPNIYELFGLEPDLCELMCGFLVHSHEKRASVKQLCSLADPAANGAFYFAVETLKSAITTLNSPQDSAIVNEMCAQVGIAVSRDTVPKIGELNRLAGLPPRPMTPPPSKFIDYDMNRNLQAEEILSLPWFKSLPSEHQGALRDLLLSLERTTESAEALETIFWRDLRPSAPINTDLFEPDLDECFAPFAAISVQRVFSPALIHGPSMKTDDGLKQIQRFEEMLQQGRSQEATAASGSQENHDSKDEGGNKKRKRDLISRGAVEEDPDEPQSKVAKTEAADSSPADRSMDLDASAAIDNVENEIRSFYASIAMKDEDFFKELDQKMQHFCRAGAEAFGSLENLVTLLNDRLALDRPARGFAPKIDGDLLQTRGKVQGPRATDARGESAVRRECGMRGEHAERRWR